jgi:hypothetical protein
VARGHNILGRTRADAMGKRATQHIGACGITAEHLPENENRDRE